MSELPRYCELPISADAPPGSSWGVFGRDDQLGTLNLLTSELRLQALTLARRGQVFGLDLMLDQPRRAFLPTRSAPKHVLTSRRNGNTRDEYLDGFFPQYSSQWDGLRHMRHPVHGFYNWTEDEDVATTAGLLGIQNFARHGVVGRGVLLDVARFLAGRGERLAPDERREFPASLLDDVAAAQNVDLRTGDIVMFRTGVGAMIAADESSGLAADRYDFQSPGLRSEEATLAWLWDRHVSAIVSDNAAIEAWPPRSDDELLHFTAIPLLGVVFGELFDLEELAADCAEDRVYECLFMAKPLMLRGGVGSPANAMAIK